MARRRADSELELTEKFGVRIPNGFHGNEPDIIDALLEMTAKTVQTNQLFYGWTATLERSSLGEWRYSITPKDKHE